MKIFSDLAVVDVPETPNEQNATSGESEKAQEDRTHEETRPSYAISS